MKAVFATNDPVRLSFAEAVLSSAGIEAVVLDEQTSSIFGGALPWVKRRLMVADEDADAARRHLMDALSGDDAAQDIAR